MTLAEIVTRITDECPDNEYTHDALNALRHLATLPAVVPDASWFAEQVCEARNIWGRDHEQRWLETDECHPDDFIGNFIREALLTQRGDAQDAT